ncbi:MAG: Gfo/Idh/MocA family oxidoreductase [Bacteroidales bacterium]|nr:Gfo/Idh/MocA family oxidoreductase [Bacteroidales bacterium]MBQ6667305.1 Gfo/Idh/MocA family oxidoreductase [Bacteroidales bacterium]
MSRFTMMGVGGYIAIRHLKAIKETGNELVSAYDRSDSVGIMDSYFPHASFFTEQELFDRHNSLLRDKGEGFEWATVCTPNYLHDSHVRYGLRMGANVICEKPLVLNPWNLDGLANAEEREGRRVYTILQLRLHPSVIALKSEVEKAQKNSKYDVDLTYITSRGNWYYASWKGDPVKSGGLATNIGVHFYDMLIWIFGPVKQNVVHISTHDRVAGFLELEKARVRYFLSINEECLPEEAVANGKRTFRSIRVDGSEFEFSEGFTELHTESYRHILKGEGFGIKDVRPCIEVVSDIRHAQPVGLMGDYHPLARKPLSAHPFRWSR